MIFLSYTQENKNKKTNDIKKKFNFFKMGFSIAKTKTDPHGESIKGTGFNTYFVIRKKREVMGQNQTQRKRRRRS